MLKSHCLVPKIAKLFFDISSINFKVYGADSQLNWSSIKTDWPCHRGRETFPSLMQALAAITGMVEAEYVVPSRQTKGGQMFFVVPVWPGGVGR